MFQANFFSKKKPGHCCHAARSRWTLWRQIGGELRSGPASKPISWKRVRLCNHTHTYAFPPRAHCHGIMLRSEATNGKKQDDKNRDCCVLETIDEKKNHRGLELTGLTSDLTVGRLAEQKQRTRTNTTRLVKH